MKKDKDVLTDIELVIDNYYKLRESIKANRRQLFQGGVNYQIITSALFIIEEELLKHQKDIRL